MDDEALALHKQLRGKIGLHVKAPLANRHDLSLTYTPGVAAVSRAVAEDPLLARVYTNKANTVAVISDGSAVLGLGDIGPEAALPVMEGKALLFKELADIDAFPLVLGTKDIDILEQTVRAVAPSFGGINLEDISAPRCFELEARLQDLDIPVMHDDQHGTAVVAIAALMNALKIAGKTIGESKIVIIGAGAAGFALTKLLHEYKPRQLIVTDRKGIISADRELSPEKQEIAALTQASAGSLSDALKDADALIGVSTAGLVTKEMVASMNKAVVLALANPVPEINRLEAVQAGAKVYACGRSDDENQVNNVLAFPGLFKGALQAGATSITNEMKRAAITALAGAAPEGKVLPDPLDKNVPKAIAAAVAATLK